ncbi:MAG TPA: DsbA family protein [Candidatus Margulisiibacteriota bacterium]|nr:DsbA family protein [Candidatus Margulisiibacteriota bacterium]
MEPLRLIVYSDYLCPWCYLGTVRLNRIGAEFGARVQFEWHSFLLRPQPDPRRTLEQFRAYTQSWQRVAAEPDAPAFRVWQGDAGPPSHSLPPHLAAKAAARLGAEAFQRMHAALLRAYFTENRNITDRETLLAVWCELNLPQDAFSYVDDPGLLQETTAQYHEALEHGIGGVPAIRVPGRAGALIGAQPVETLGHWINRLLSLSASA